MSVVYMTPAQAPAAPLSQQEDKFGAHTEAMFHEEESSASPSPSVASSEFQHSVFPQNYQHPVIGFKVRRTVTQKTTHPIAAARIAAQFGEKASASYARRQQQSTSSKRAPQRRRQAPKPKKADAEEKKLEKMPKLAKVECGMEVTGIVTSVVEFGCFMDIGWKRDALLHQREVYQTKGCNPYKEFHVGQKFGVYVTSVFEGDATQQARASLSLIAPTGKIYRKDLYVGQEFLAEVKRVRPFGLVMDYGAEVDGFVHQSELFDLPENFKEGETLDVEIARFNKKTGRVELRLPNNTGYVNFEDLKVGDKYRGKIYRKSSFGVFVTFSAGFNSFVRRSDLRGDLADFAIGSFLHVEITHLDKVRELIDLRRQFSPEELAAIEVAKAKAEPKAEEAKAATEEEKAAPKPKAAAGAAKLSTAAKRRRRQRVIEERAKEAAAKAEAERKAAPENAMEELKAVAKKAREERKAVRASK